MTGPNRVSAGVPTGGQFAPAQRQRADVQLVDAAPDPQVQAAAARTGWVREAGSCDVYLRRGGRIEVVVEDGFVSVFDRSDTAGIDDMPLLEVGYDDTNPRSREVALGQVFATLGPPPEPLSPDERQELYELEIEFAGAGGRGVDLAERLDELRARATGFERRLATEGTTPAGPEPQTTWALLVSQVGYQQAERLFYEHDGSPTAAWAALTGYPEPPERPNTERPGAPRPVL